MRIGLTWLTWLLLILGKNLLLTLARPKFPVVLLLTFLQQQALGNFLGPDLDYHIQTDQGPDRFFRFQTSTGQFRKEQQHPDGSVTGSYGWVDPNGVLRLFDYVSDNLGYRIEKKRLFKVGQTLPDGRVVQTNGGDLNIGFEVFPLDFESDPEFSGIGRSDDAVPLGGSSGFRAIHGPEGSFHLTPSYQVASLTSTGDPSNPVSKQGQATYFEADPILVKAHHPAPPPKPKVVIGARRAEAVKPAPRARSQIVIGAAASNSNSRSRKTERRTVVIGSTHNGRSSGMAAPRRSESRRRGIVIGRTARMLTF